MDLVCHEMIDTVHQKQSHKLCQHDDYMSSNSNSSSYSYSLSPPTSSLSPPPHSLSQYSSHSTLSSGIGSLVGTEDSNFGDLTRSSSNCSLLTTGDSSSSSSSQSFANFRRQYSPDVEEVIVQEEQVEVVEQAEHEERSHVSRSGATKRSQPVIYYNHSPKIRKADRDPVFLENRCLANLFALEAQLYHSTRGHMKGEINEQMRRIVAGWMMEVSCAYVHLKGSMCCVATVVTIMCKGVYGVGLLKTPVTIACSGDLTKLVAGRPVCWSVGWPVGELSVRPSLSTSCVDEGVRDKVVAWRQVLR